jgi:hypothetical protein
MHESLNLQGLDFDTAYKPDALHDFEAEMSNNVGQIWSYRRMIELKDCPHLLTPDKIRERRNLEARFGAKSAFIQSMLYGRFQSSEDGNNIFEPAHVELLKKAMRGTDTKPIPGDVRAAGDVSGGGDKQILMVREGTEIIWINVHQCENEILQAEYWVETLKQIGIAPHQFWIDGGGIGAPVANYMEMRLGYSGINRFNANTGPLIGHEFKDRYTELHWWIKELLLYEALRLPFSKDLIEQCRDRLYIEADVGIVKTEPKDKYRASHQQRSPDELDTLVYLFSDFPMDQIRRGRATALQKRTGIEKTKDPHSDWAEYERKAGIARTGGILPYLRKLPTMRDVRRDAGIK